MSSAKTIKSLVKKNVGDKSTFGTNPSDPWSAKANIAESASLNQYLLSRGINPKFVSKDTKVAHSKSNAFLKWQADHARRLGEESEELVSEATDKADVIAMDIPFLIRMLEYAREDAKSDMALHKVVEKLINIRKRGVMTMREYKYVTSIRECVELTEEKDCEFPPKNEKEWKAYAQKRAEAWRQKLLKVDEAKEADYGYDYQRSVQTVKALAGKKPVDMKSLAARMQASYAKDEKKPVKEDNEQIDEISKELANSYMWQAKSDRDKIDNRRMKLHDKNSQQMRYSGSISLRRHKNITKLLAKSGKRTDGISRALDRLTKEETVDEAKLPSNLVWDGGSVKKDPAVVAGNKRKKNYQAYLRRKAAKDKAQEPVKENTLDSLAATQAPCDCANTPDTVAPKDKNKKLIQMSKSARIIKSIYKRKGMKEEVVYEEMYDHEKEDKSVSGLKKPKVTQPTEKAPGGETPKAAIVMSGGKTMTGEPRDTIVIDPAMKGKPGGPNDPTVKK